MVLNAVGENVGEIAIISPVSILVGNVLIVARRRSYSCILYVIIIKILLIYAIFISIVLCPPLQHLVCLLRGCYFVTFWQSVSGSR